MNGSNVSFNNISTVSNCSGSSCLNHVNSTTCIDDIIYENFYKTQILPKTDLSSTATDKPIFTRYSLNQNNFLNKEYKIILTNQINEYKYNVNIQYLNYLQ